MKLTPKSEKLPEPEKLTELVEETMVKVAERPDLDLTLLARLDRLRMELRHALRRRRSRGATS